MNSGDHTPPIVGRTAEMERLKSALRTAEAGSPAVVLVSGEMGVGKTRLVTDFVAQSGATAVAGGCVPVAGEALPFAPLTQGLRDLARGMRPTDRARLLQEWPREVSRLLPDLASPVPAPRARPSDDADAPGAADALAPANGDAGARASALDVPVSISAQARLFESVLALLARLGRDGPVVHVVEDLHWADRSTLDLIRFLANNVSNEPVVLLLTYRSFEVGEADPLAPWLAELSRLAITTRLTLERLSVEDTERLLSDLLGRQPEPDVLADVHARADGNPLFVEHLAAASAEPGSALPATLRDLLTARVATLPQPTRRLLRAASVIGRVAELSLLADIVGQEAEDVEDGLRPALERHVMEPRAGVSYGFRHPAFREVVYAELLPGERLRLHSTAARILSSREVVGDSARAAATGEVARHWQVAGDLVRALHSAIDAGLAAEQLFAFADAHESFRRAVGLWDRVRAEARQGTALDHLELLAHAAQAASLVGEGADAVRLTERALQSGVSTRQRLQLLERLGAFHFIAGHGERAESAYRAAIALLPEVESPRLRAKVYAGLALLAAAWSRLDEAVEAGRLAISAAREGGARREEGVALNALGVVAAFRGDVDTGERHLRAALAIARDVDNPDDVAVAYINLGHVLGMASELDEAVEVCTEGFEVMRSVGLVRQYGSLLRANAAECLIKSGRLAEAEELVLDGLRQHPRGLQGAAVLMQAGRLAVVRGALSVAWERLQQARLRIDDEGAPDEWRRELCEAVAEVELWEGRPRAAYEAVIEGLELVATADDAHFGGHLVMLGLRALADEAELAGGRTRADRESFGLRRDGMLDAIQKLDPDPFDVASAVTREAAAVAVTCRAERVRLGGGGVDAHHAWSQAAVKWRLLGRPFAAGYALWREAEACFADRANARGIVALRAAWGTAERLGAQRLEDELLALAKRHRADLHVAAEASHDADDGAAALADLGLTAREREVLAALAAGRTNGEIADELFISVKTASVHVSNILRKLDVSGRHEAARIAHRLGVRS